jgi:hypothetical protein
MHMTVLQALIITAMALTVCLNFWFSTRSRLHMVLFGFSAFLIGAFVGDAYQNGVATNEGLKQVTQKSEDGFERVPFILRDDAVAVPPYRAGQSLPR